MLEKGYILLLLCLSLLGTKTEGKWAIKTPLLLSKELNGNERQTHVKANICRTLSAKGHV